MKATVVRYRAKSDRADENQRLIEAVFAQLHEREPVGFTYQVFRLEDGATIESVYIPEERRRTICISTQAGCPLKCAFCLTGIAGYKRNLMTWEILGQVATVMADAPDIDPDGAAGGCCGPAPSVELTVAPQLVMIGSRPE